MPYEKVAKEVILSMGGQVDLLFTLSVAICGGITALVFQLAIHNKTRTGSQINIIWPWLLIATFLVLGISILCGYFARGSITDSIPSIYKIDFSKFDTWGSAKFVGDGTLKFLVWVQFLTFLGGIFALFLLVFKNKELI